MQRDYGAEMRARIDAGRSGPEYNARQLANRIVENLLVTDPDLLNGWLQAHAEELLWSTINDINRRERAGLQAAAGRVAAGHAVREHDRGNDAPLKGWLESREEADESHTQKLLGDFRSGELEYAIGRYEKRARANGLKAAFLSALRKKVGDGQVRDHFTNEQLDQLWAELSSL